MTSGLPAVQPASYGIPSALNLALAGVVFCLAIALLWLASRVTLPATLAAGVAYAFVLLTGYALLHEAGHDLLHPRRPVNDAAGAVLGWLFPIPFTLLKVTHVVHHCCNRTDHEMFDCYYPGDNRLVKTIQWYGILTGLWWTLIPVGSLLLALHPAWLRSPPFRRARTTAVLFDDFGPRQVRRVRQEVLFGVVFWLALFLGLELRWDAVLVLYACFAFNWSTRQYVTHAFTPRDVRDGALNLRVSRAMGWLLLNGQWDRVHHRYPHVPWTALPCLGQSEGYDTGYWRQYLRLWVGPRVCTEPGPAVLPRVGYEALG